MNKTISVDFGGTRIRAAVVYSNGRCGPLVCKSTERHRSAEQIIANLAEVIEKAWRKRDGIAAITIGVPTVLDKKKCLVECDNLPSMGGFPLGKRLQKHFNVPVMLFNDAACFTMGEWWRGIAKGTKNFCGVTLGTGIGVGIIIDGKMYYGSHGCSGEIWKSPFGTGIIEDYVCGRTIEQEYEKRTGRHYGGEEISVLAKKGDLYALETFAQFGRSLGRVISFLINVIAPEIIVFGGSVSQSFDFFSETLSEVVLSGTVTGKKVRLKKSKLGEKAALLGAAKLYWDEF